MTAAAVAAIAFGAAPAWAADYYVDRDVVDATNTCTQAQPCDQIGEALGLADANDSSADTVHVGRSTGAYPALSLPNTRATLLGGEFNAGADGTVSRIDGTSDPGITLDSSSFPRTVDGLTIEGGDSTDPLCALQDVGSTNVTIQKNVFDEPSNQLDGHICLSGSPIIRDNTVFGNADSQQEGIRVNSAISPQITGNTAQGVDRPINVLSGGTTTATIKDNTLQVRSNAGAIAAGVYLVGTSGEISGNEISLDPTSTLPVADGIHATNSSGGTLRLSRNSIFDFNQGAGHGVNLLTTDPVTLDNDVIAGNTFGVNEPGNGPSLSIINSTIVDSLSAEVRFFGNPISATIDSSIIGNAGITNTSGASCSSAFSRGPASSPFCGPFATSATPAFVDASANDYHLTSTGNGSLIEMGNPAGPAPPALDIDGQARAIDFDGNCDARRDIGADELPTSATPNCSFTTGGGGGDLTPPDTSIQGFPVVRAKKRRALVFFTLTSTEPGSTFRCSIDGGPFLACTSPFGAVLRRGGHSLSVVATDRAGNQDPSPARVITIVRRKKKKHRHGKKQGGGRKGA